MATTPLFVPEKSYGQRSLEGYNPWGRKESDTTEHVCACAHTHTHTHTHTLRGAKAEDMGEDLSEEGPVLSCWGTTVRIKSWQYISAPLPHGVLIWRWQDLAQRSLSVSTNQSKSLSCSDEAERVLWCCSFKSLAGISQPAVSVESEPQKGQLQIKGWEL